MKSWWFRLACYARPHWRGVLLLVVLMVIGIGAEVLKPWPTKLLVDGVLSPEPGKHLPVWVAGLFASHNHVTLLAWLAAATVVLFLTTWTMSLLQAYLQVGLGNRMVYDLGGRIFEHIQRQSIVFHGRHRTGDLVRRVMTDAGCIRALILWVFLPLLTSLASLGAMFLVMWRLDHVLTVAALLVTPFLGLLIKLFAKRLGDLTYHQQQLEGEVMALAEQTLTALPIVKAFTREELESRRFRELSGRTIKAYLKATMAGVYFKLGTAGVTALGTAAVVYIGAMQVLRGQLSLGDLLVFLAYLGSLYAPLETMSYLSGQFAAAAAGSRRVLEILDADEAVGEQPGSVDVAVVAGVSGASAIGEVQIENVVFGYETGRPVLHGVSLSASPGQVVALVGPTGAGKSTLVSLVPRFFDPWEGRVTLGGKDVRELKLASLRAQVSLVLQEPFLLPLTVRENIAYGRPGASRAEVERAAEAANAAEFIGGLPLGYDTILGERGASLSGGQRQRLSIARALLKDAPILILDEPTSALDAGTEAQVMGALEKLMAGRTVLVIAHRLSTVRRADKIVVLDQGRVIEVGTHKDLVAAGGHYARQAALQMTEPVPEVLA